MHWTAITINSRSEEKLSNQMQTNRKVNVAQIVDNSNQDERMHLNAQYINHHCIRSCLDMDWSGNFCQSMSIIKRVFNEHTSVRTRSCIDERLHSLKSLISED